MNVRIPNYKRIIEIADPWRPKTSNGSYNSQHTVPTDEKLLEKIGIKEGQSIVCVAGGPPKSWAAALSEKTKVHYTDVSKAMVKLAKRKNTKILKFSAINALRLPNEECDWLFSFEPHTIGLSSAMPIALLRALVYAKGAKIIWVGYGEIEHDVIPYLKQAYNPEIEIKQEKTACLEHGKYARIISHRVLTVTSTPDARAKAKLDLEIIGLLQKKNEFSSTALVTNPKIKKITADEEKVREALERINSFSLCVAANRKVNVVA